MTISIMSPIMETSESLQRGTVASPSDPAPKGARFDVAFDKVVVEFLERRGEAADLVFGRSQADDQKSVAKAQQKVIIDQLDSLAVIDNNVVLQDKIKEIRELTELLSDSASHDKSREILYCIYTRAAEAIGRNSVEAIKADAIHRIEALASIGVLSGHVPRKENPEEYIERKIVPLLDADMRSHAFDMNLYRTGMRSFYQVLGSWRSRGRAKRVFAGR